MIPFIMQLKLPHVLVGMHTDYLYQELEPPLQKQFLFSWYTNLELAWSHTVHCKEIG